ncbi:MAG: tRNA (adenosine(37)-N6)-dimethylallyltransferase MiaA [Desulfobulbaceae bacterium S3730MH12]|nr:MAG: tRNA (adenosine(37)-N6)-dimethylallyltransferase MiaA [Desulfobulbaceae bacterium S3730MH12]OEU81611.1 MAG: tRNA (adenosine(37)-N6)-dimethylallyltransferase MiaA [Desulfobulbaceae bacterium C00003063]
MNVQIIDQPVLILVGPTAIGKTALSLELARRFNCEIVSVDSMQVYKYMDIGTAKVTNEERGGITHHLINIVEPDEPYDAARFTEDALLAIREIHKRGRVPLLTGGTGLYLRALISGIFEGPPSDSVIRKKLKQRLKEEGHHALHKELVLYDGISANKIHPNDTQRLLRALEIYHSTGRSWSTYLESKASNRQRIHFSNMLQIGLACDRSVLYDRINLRTEIMLDSDFEKEVRGLLDMGYGRGLKSMSSIGYRHMINYIFGDYQYEEMKRLLARDTRRYAKRQLTWFGKNDDLHWIEVKNISRVMKTVELLLDIR